MSEEQYCYDGQLDCIASLLFKNNEILDLILQELKEIKLQGEKRDLENYMKPIYDMLTDNQKNFKFLQRRYNE